MTTAARTLDDDGRSSRPMDAGQHQHTPGTTAGAGPVRVGLVGFGLAGSVFHAPLIATTPGLELAVVVTSRPEAAARVTHEHPGARAVASVEDLWAAGVDLVVVATPNDSHVPLARAALGRGLATVVDKPLAKDGRTARALDALAQAHGAPLTVFQNRRWDGDFLTVAQAVGDGRLGEVRRFESRFERWAPDAQGGWRESADPAVLPGLVHDLGAHLVDQAVQLFGPVATVYAEADVRRDGVGAIDDAFLALTHTGGVQSHLWMSAVAADQGPRFRVLGSHGALTTWGLDPQEAALAAGRRPAGDGLADDGTSWGVTEPRRTARLTARDASVTDVPVLPGDYPAFYAAVAGALLGGGPMPVSVSDAAAVLDVLATAHRAAATGEVTTVVAD